MDFGVLVYVIRSLDSFANDPISCTNLFTISNSNGNPFTDFDLLAGSCNFDGLNTLK
jgi:hypothetical protein